MSAAHTLQQLELAAARELCKIEAGCCGTDEADTWKIYSEQFKADAKASLAAAKVPDLLAQRDELLAALQGLLNIVNDSRGVAGYHLNGDTAEWDEFDEVDAASAAISKATGQEGGAA